MSRPRARPFYVRRAVKRAVLSAVRVPGRPSWLSYWLLTLECGHRKRVTGRKEGAPACCFECGTGPTPLPVLHVRRVKFRVVGT